jgi:hypothetical protein
MVDAAFWPKGDAPPEIVDEVISVITLIVRLPPPEP